MTRAETHARSERLSLLELGPFQKQTAVLRGDRFRSWWTVLMM